MSTFNEIFSQLRKERGYTLQDIGDRVHVSPQAVKKWEEGTQPDFETVVQLAEFFGVSLDYLMTGKDTRGTLSVAERCAQNDDLVLFEQRQAENTICNTDESNKNILDYIIQYKSQKIFRKHYLFLFSKFIGSFANGKNRDAVKKYYGDFFELLVRTETLDEFEKEQCIEKGQIPFHTHLLLEEQTKTEWQDMQKGKFPVLRRDIFSVIIRLAGEGNKTAEKLIFPKNQWAYWFFALPYIVEDACALGEFDLADRVLGMIESDNEVQKQKQSRLCRSGSGRGSVGRDFGGREEAWRAFSRVSFHGEQLLRMLKSGAVQQARRALKIGCLSGAEGVSGLPVAEDRTIQAHGAVLQRALKIFAYIRRSRGNRVDEYECRVYETLHDGNKSEEEKAIEILRRDDKEFYAHFFPFLESYDLFLSAERRYPDCKMRLPLAYTMNELVRSENKNLFEETGIGTFENDFRFFEYAMAQADKQEKNNVLNRLFVQYPSLQYKKYFLLLLQHGAVFVEEIYDSTRENPLLTAALKMMLEIAEENGAKKSE